MEPKINDKQAKLDASTFDFLGAYTRQPNPELVALMTNHLEKVNNAIQRHTQGLPEREKAYVTEVLMSVFYSEISIEVAASRIQEYFKKRAQIDVEALYTAAFARQ